MHTPGTVLLIYLLSLVHAQYGPETTTTTTTESPTTSQTSSTTTAAASAVQTVDVGEDGLVFNPDTLHVSPGGKVEFHFYPGNHSVAQAAFSNPCHPLSDSSFFSGFIPGSSGDSKETFTLTINDTNPIWYYCGQIGHCQAGMVGVINPPDSGADTLAAFKSAASNADDITVPNAVAGGILGTTSDESTSSSATGTSTTSSTGTTMATSGSSTTSATMPASTGSAGVFGPASFSEMCLILALSLCGAMGMM